jgi:hypothetical protein
MRRDELLFARSHAAGVNSLIWVIMAAEFGFSESEVAGVAGS